MANPTRRGFLTMAAGLAAQPKGALSSPKAEILPSHIADLIPTHGSPHMAWLKDEGALSNNLDVILSNPLEEMFPELIKDGKHKFDKWLFSDENKTNDRFEKFHSSMEKLVYDKDLSAYRDLKKMGLNDKDLSTFITWLKEDADMAIHSGLDALSNPEWKEAAEKITHASPIPSLTNIGGYLARAGYEPGQGTAVHPDMTIPFDMNRIVNDNMRPLPAPSRSNPGLELNLHDLEAVPVRRGSYGDVY